MNIQINHNHESLSSEYILLVDDQPDNLRLLSRFLDNQGYNVRKVTSGKLALTVVENDPPQLILLDIMMPEMDGYQVCRELKSRPNTAEIPVIFLSALDDGSDKVKGFEVGGADYLTKPFQMAELIVRIANQINLRKFKKQTEEQNNLLQKLNSELEARVEERTIELIQKNQQLTQLEAELREALVKEKEINDFRSHIITTVSHEYRTPLTTIYSSSELLERYFDMWTPDKRVKHLKRIQTAVKHLNTLVSEVLLLHQVEKEQLQLNFVSMDLVEFCRELIEDLEITAKSGQKIVFNYSGESCLCQWDENILRQILNNLLINGIKFSGENQEIGFHLFLASDHVRFEITDHGIGIPKENQSRLFESFFRAHNVGNIQGTGLGLSIVKKCVEACRGTIAFHSEEGVGTKFMVSLPCLSVENVSPVDDVGHG